MFAEAFVQGPESLSLTSVYAEIKRSVGCECGKGINALKGADFSILGNDVLSRMAAFMSARDVDSLRNTSRAMRKILELVVPGLKLTLFAHQKLALKWMEEREMSKEMLLLSSPTCPCSSQESDENIRYALLHNKNNRDVWTIDLLTGEIGSQSHELTLRHVRGGLLCDEPGMLTFIWNTSFILLFHRFGKNDIHDCLSLENYRENASILDRELHARVLCEACK